MTSGEFIDSLSGEFGPGMDERCGGYILAYGLWGTALGLVRHSDRRIAFRGSWALEWAYFHDREGIVPYMRDFLENFFTAANHSVHRHYTKMLCDMMRRGLLVLDSWMSEKIAERSFDLLINADTKVAVKVWCMEILFDLSPLLDWVSEHLAEVVRRQMELSPTPAMLNHGRKVLKRGSPPLSEGQGVGGADTRVY